MKKRPLRKTIGRGCEYLESRHMMTGNVVVQYSGDTLVFTESSSTPNTANQIWVERISSSQIRVSNDPDTFDPVTKINGYSTARVFNFTAATSTTGAANSMRFDLKGGNDSIHLLTATNVRLAPKNLTVNMGAGSDYVSLADVNVYGNLSISTDGLVAVGSAGADRVYLNYVSVARLTSIDTGGGKDIVSLSNVFTNDDISIDTADGGSDSAADVVSLSNVTASYRTYQYEQGLITITTGKGADKVTVKNSKADFIRVKTLAGNDTVNFEGVLFDNDGSYVDGGLGVDSLRKKSNGGDGLGYVLWQSFETSFT